MKNSTALIAVALVSAGLATWNLLRPSPVADHVRPAPVAAPRSAPAATVVERDAPSALAPAPASGKKAPLQNPAARVAMSLVGAETTAELVWTQAINDPQLPKGERQDLIEDLNEVGYANLKRPTPADLELIKARLEIIDRLSPEALDKTNADAFAEARKDLVAMLAKAGQ